MLPESFFLGYPGFYKSLAQSTHRDYYRALVKVRDCLPKEGIWFFNLDAALFCIVASWHLEKGSSGIRQLATNAVCAIAHRVPTLKHRMPLTRRALQGWKMQQPSKQARALTRRMLIAFCGAMLSRGRVEEAECTSIAWGGLLRANEALALVADDIVPPGDKRLSDFDHECAAISDSSRLGLRTCCALYARRRRTSASGRTTTQHIRVVMAVPCTFTCEECLPLASPYAAAGSAMARFNTT